MAKGAALPKHVLLSELLIREIAAGHLEEGSRLPPERVLAQKLGVAVGTLRRALGELERQGLLKRIQGSGNYIQHRQKVESVYAFLRLELAEGGGLPHADTLEVLTLNKPANAPDFGPSRKAHRIRRLRRLGEAAVALEEVWLDGQFRWTLRAADLGPSLYLTYREQLGLTISRTEDRVGVALTPDWAPAEYPAPPGTPAGFIERIAEDINGYPVEYSRTWFDAERARYTVRQD
ncbi:MAG: GntR family transcriptional regulator [Pseudomonadota bacterium]